MQLHIFCDASESAFGTAAYFRQVYQSYYTNDWCLNI